MRRTIYVALLSLSAALALACRSGVSEGTSPPARAVSRPDSPAPVDRPKAESAPAKPAAAASEERAEAGAESGRLAGLTAAHNRVRAPLGLPPLEWSPELARFAQAWAEKLQRGGCDLQHRPRSGPDAQRHGENLYGASGRAATADDVVAAWAVEQKSYNAKTNRCKGVCGHYTQLVWRKTTRVGCAMATCGDAEVWVCNYDPPGNYLGQRPY